MLSESISVLFQYAKLKHLVHLPIGLLNGHPSNITTVTNKYILFLVKKNCVFFSFQNDCDSTRGTDFSFKKKMLSAAGKDRPERQNGIHGKRDSGKNGHSEDGQKLLTT